MKALYLYILLFALSLADMQAQEKKVSYLGAVDAGSLVKEGRTVRFSMDVDLSGISINAQHTVAFIPVIISKDGSREFAFPPVVIDGRTRNKVYLRAQELESVEYPPYHDGSAKAVINSKSSNELYHYSAETPYEKWMLGAKTEVREEIHGCTNCGVGKSSKNLEKEVLPAYVPEYRLGHITRPAQDGKDSIYSREIRLTFPHDSHKIVPELDNNRAQLDTITNYIMRLMKDDMVEIKGIHISGYASPEGTEKHNLRLSDRRAKALAGYIVRNTGAKEESIEAEGKGEDWKGFIDLFESCKDLKGWAGMNDLIRRYPGKNDKSESRFRIVNPESYRYMFKKLYPALRHNTCMVHYKIKEFGLKDAKELIRTRPELLSLHEMFGVAESYGAGTPEYEETMAVALKYFPDSDAARNANAMIAVSRNDFGGAIRILKESDASESSPESLNTLGVAYAKDKEYKKAEEAFEKAAKKGSAEAARNLGEIRKVIEQL